MPLSDEQREEIRSLAAAGKSGKLNDLAEKWGVPFKEVARTYADFQRQLNPHPENTGPAKPADNLTDDQKRVIRRLAEQGNAARLIILAEEWNVLPLVINRYYSDCREDIRRNSRTSQTENQVLPPAPAVSPVADVKAQPGQIAVLPRNWPLIQARLSCGLAPKEVAVAVGLKPSEYQRVEDGLQLPTADQAAKICALLKVDMARTFVAAAQDQITTRGGIKGLSLLGILRARARLSMKDLAAAVSDITDVRMSTTLISMIERCQLKQPLAVDYPKMIEALAQYFSVSSEMITAQVPPSWIQTVASNTAALHAAIKTSYAALPTTPADPLMIAAGNGGDSE